MGIRIIITGGTFDKGYDELKGELTFKNTHLPEILEQVRCTQPIELEINQLKDSLDMADEDRLSIGKSCALSPETMIVITHGTDTMDKTAQFLDGMDELKGKTIVMTGAMVPYSFKHSDAMFNLGASIMAVQLVGPGVFVCMNGRVFSGNRVFKDREQGVFQEIV